MWVLPLFLGGRKEVRNLLLSHCDKLRVPVSLWKLGASEGTVSDQQEEACVVETRPDGGEGGQRERGLPVSAIVSSCWLSHSQESPERKNNGNVGNDVGLLALGELGAFLPGG